MSVITTSLVVEFDTAEGEGILTAEIDSSETGLNGGDTSFIPGDSPGFLIYKTSNVVIDAMHTSAGVITPSGSGTTEDIENFLVFAGDRKQSLSYPNNGSFTGTWLGLELDTYTVGESAVTLTNTNSVVGVLHVNYDSNYLAYRLNNVPLTLGGLSSFQVAIYIVGHTV